MESEERSSTSSTVSGVFRTILQSPAPVCMFYFSHPFGVSSPAVRDAARSVANDQMSSGIPGRRRKLHNHRDERLEKNFAACNQNRTSGLQEDFERSTRLIPWPRDTWKREFVLPPLIQFRGKHQGQATVPDLETILKTIRQAWNSPHPRSNLQSRAYEDTDTPSTNSIVNWNFGIKFTNKYKMGSGNNLTPVASGLLRRRYSVPEIIMRKHSLAQQKTYDESVAVTAPSPYRSPGPVYYKSYSTNTPNRTYPISSGSDSNLSRRPERGEMSMRKSTLLRRIWSRELKRYDTRSGSCSPPMRRSQRRLHAEPIESSRCEECRKLDDDDPSDESEEAASRKRLRLISNGKEPSDESCVSNYSRSVVSERVPMTTSSSLESSPLTNGRTRNVHIYMTPMKSDRSISEPSDQGQDMLHVEIDLDNSEENGNIRDASDQSTDENENKAEIESSLNTTTEINENTNGKRDSPLDRFISKLLIDNLADLADEINEQFENNNNLVQNESDLKEKRVSSVYFSPEHMEAVVNRLHTSEVSSTNGTSSHDIPDPNMNKSDEAGHERIIYFPSCSLECKDDMSSYTSNCSDFELNSIPNTEVVKVSTGSTYPIGEQKEALVIPRMLGTFPRTESLEAQHSMASALDDENGNESDDSVSLVDSLDDPTNSALNEEIVSEQHEPKNGIETQEEDTASVCREKPEAFFVPIAGSELKEVQSVPVARSMPEKLKEKILQRQRELDTKRGEELKKKQKKIEKIMDPKLEEENFYEKSPVRCKKDSPVKEKPPVSKNGPKKSRTKGNAVLLRTEIGLLESYTIDSKGNMQFKPPQKTDSSLSCNTTTSTTTTTTTTTKKTSRTPITRKRSILPSKAPESAGQSFEKKSITSQTKSKKSVIKDVQKMTIFQAQSDIITPDLENGPRRVYQKTEIQDGEKRIEILEIVECIETSPETSPDRHQYTYRCGATKSALARHSKIPIPIYKLGRSAGYQKSTRCPLRESSPTTAKCLSRNLQGSASNKVDRVIAELLIDALNRPEEMGIEIVKSPKDMSRDKSQRRQNAQRRNTPRRSANSGKYQQVFEVIPEEKSSFSVDSSTDEPSRLSKIHLKSAGSNSKSSTNQIVTTATTKEVQSSSGATVATTSNNCLTSSSSSSQKTSTNSGRVAVDRAEPKAWIGFFKRHNDSSMDEDDMPSEPYPNSSVETSCQNTITTPSTNTAAAGSTTPKAISSTGCITSAESDNILKLIDQTFGDKDFENPRNSASANDPKPVTTSAAAKTSSTIGTLSNTCNTCKIKEKRTTKNTNVMDSVLKIELKESHNSSFSSHSSSSTAEASSDPKESLPRKKASPGNRSVRKPARPDIWRVQSPDICKMAIPKCKTKSRSEDDPSTEATAEIDSRSFIIVPDECNASPLRLSYATKIPQIGPDSAELKISAGLTNKCITCCFCNPELHKSIKNTASTPCVYCNRRRTPPKREEETNTESDFFQIYQSMTKSDHTHIRTTSRDSDVVSTKCTKINEKIKKYIPETSTTTAPASSQDPKSKAPKNLSRPKNIPNLPKRQGPVHKTTQNNLKSNEPKTKQANPEPKAFRFPSPYANLSSSYDRTTSPSSSSDSTCPTTPRRCPLLPATRRQNFAASHNNSKKRNSQDQDHPVKGTANNNQTILDNSNNNGNGQLKMNGQNNGWSVTVAGSYNQDLAPDLEMRLSFPKPDGKQHQQQSIIANPIVHDQKDFQRISNGNLYAESIYHDEDIVNDNYSRINNHNQALPPAINMNPKRTLTRIVSERTHSQRDINFPEVNSARNPIVSRQMAKKAIKHTECSVAVTSATRTISNFTRGRRTMSYQALNTESHRINNRDRHAIRDNSLDLGNLSSSRRMSLDSQRTPTECLALSIMGNAIAPEQKPRVPTMSEKDLTRRNNACFTRNRAFFA